MGQPGKVSKDECPILDVSPAPLRGASHRQLPSRVGFPRPSQKPRRAPHRPGGSGSGGQGSLWFPSEH